MLAVTAILVIGAASATVTPAPVAASCSIQPRYQYWTRLHPGRDPITAAYFGTVVDASGPPWDAVFTVEVEGRVAGSLPPGQRITFSGDIMCGYIKLNVGQRYLFAVAPPVLDGDGSMVFETDGPAWRWLVGGTWAQPTLDGHRLPIDPDALLSVLRHRIEALPATSTLAPPRPAPAPGPAMLLVLLSGLAGGLAMLRRLRSPA